MSASAPGVAEMRQLVAATLADPLEQLAALVEGFAASIRTNAELPGFAGLRNELAGVCESLARLAADARSVPRILLEGLTAN